MLTGILNLWGLQLRSIDFEACCRSPVVDVEHTLMAIMNLLLRRPAQFSRVGDCYVTKHGRKKFVVRHCDGIPELGRVTHVEVRDVHTDKLIGEHGFIDDYSAMWFIDVERGATTYGLGSPLSRLPLS